MISNLDGSFPVDQFAINDFRVLFRLDRSNSRGVKNVKNVKGWELNDN